MAATSSNSFSWLRAPQVAELVDGRMDHMGIDIAGQRLFATAFDNHTLSVIDLKAGRQISLIPLSR